MSKETTPFSHQIIFMHDPFTIQEYIDEWKVALDTTGHTCITSQDTNLWALSDQEITAQFEIPPSKILLGIRDVDERTKTNIKRLATLFPEALIYVQKTNFTLNEMRELYVLDIEAGPYQRPRRPIQDCNERMYRPERIINFLSLEQHTNAAQQENQTTSSGIETTSEADWITTDRQRLPFDGRLTDVFPELREIGGRVSLEDLMRSNTAAGEALRRTLGGSSTEAVAVTKKSPKDNPDDQKKTQVLSKQTLTLIHARSSAE